VSADEPVPKLPRGRAFKLSMPELLRIAMFAAMLVAVIILARPCGNAVSNFVMKFDNGSAQGSAVNAMPKPDNVAPQQPQEYEVLRPGMSEEETKAAIERAKARAAGQAGSAAGSGSAAGTGTGTGSAGR
jgi:hypothetical protein